MVRICPHDREHAISGQRVGWLHVCWGPIDPAHVNETQARGAYDVGEIVPLCRGAHRMLDQVLGPAEFAQVTGLDLAHLAAGYPQAFVERGGTL